MSRAVALDHVGIVGHDLDALAAVFVDLGFQLTPLARHEGGRTGNRCVMLAEGGYLELLSTLDGGTSATLQRFLSYHAGAHILALEIGDPDLVLQRLRLAWDAVPHITYTQRLLDDADPAAGLVGFALITPPDPPEGRVHLIQHTTPGTQWRDGFLRHLNNAVALEEVHLHVPSPAVTAAWYSVLAGRPVVPDSDGGYRLDLPRGRVRILPGSSPPLISGITLRTSDAATAIRLHLTDRGMSFDITNNMVEIDAAGVTLRFT